MDAMQPQQPDQPDQGGGQEKCVLIEVDEQGQVSVGTYPNIPEELKAGLQPAASLDEALNKAKQLLAGGDQASQDAADQKTGFEQGYRSAQGTPMFEQVGR